MVSSVCYDDLKSLELGGISVRCRELETVHAPLGGSVVERLFAIGRHGERFGRGDGHGSVLERAAACQLRVCGMVKNVGEPGGGPFLAVNPDGTVSLQILESSQIDLNDPEKKAMFEKGTHFNPVDLVCALKNYKGEKFNLPDYVDKNTGFISYKSKDGRELKALELPGLWNGAMSDWNTIFVEVPIETFNPVKTVNDLLRQEHQ